jgi:hypothetical protein
MSHLTEESISLLDVDLLVTECVRANREEEAFAYLISPFISDFRIPSKLAKFVSNVINVSDAECVSDLIGLLASYGGKVFIITRSPQDLMKTTIAKSFVKRQARTLLQFHQKGCDIRFNPRLHAKVTVTSQGAVSGSFNLTESGWFLNVEEGSFFPNTTGESKRQYKERLSWAEDLCKNHSVQLVEEDLKIE